MVLIKIHLKKINLSNNNRYKKDCISFVVVSVFISQFQMQLKRVQLRVAGGFSTVNATEILFQIFLTKQKCCINTTQLGRRQISVV